MDLYTDGVSKGIRKSEICELLGVNLRSIQRWLKYGIRDERQHCTSRLIHNKTDKATKDKIISICCSTEFVNLTPHCIIPILADRVEYYASESTFYRILREHNLLTHRQKSKKRVKSEKEELIATGPNSGLKWYIKSYKSGTNI